MLFLRRAIDIACPLGAAPQLVLDQDEWAISEAEVPFQNNTTPPRELEVAARAAGVAKWQESHTYALGATGQMILPKTRNGFQWKLSRITTGGTSCFSGAVEPTWNLNPGSETLDNGCVWKHRGREPALLQWKIPGQGGDVEPGHPVLIRDAGVGGNGDQVVAGQNADGGWFVTRPSALGQYENDIAVVMMSNVLGGNAGGFALGTGAGSPVDTYLTRFGTGTRIRPRFNTNGQNLDYPLLTMMGGTTANLATSGTQYFSAVTFTAPDGTEATHQRRVPQLRVWGMWCSLSTAPVGGASYTLTLRNEGADSTSTCVLTGNSTTCIDTEASPISITNSNRLNWSATAAGTPVAATATCAVLYNVESSANGFGW